MSLLDIRLKNAALQAEKLAAELRVARQTGTQGNPDLFAALFEAALLEKQLMELRKADPDAQGRVDRLAHHAEDMILLRPKASKP